MNTAIKDMLSEMTAVKLICFRALERRLHRGFAEFDEAHNIFVDHHDGIIHDEACSDGQRHQRKIVETGRPISFMMP